MRHCCGGDDSHEHEHSHPHAPHSVQIGTHYLLALNDAKQVVAQQPIPKGAVIAETLAAALSPVEYDALEKSEPASRFHPYITERGEKFWVAALGGASLCSTAENATASLVFYDVAEGIFSRLTACTDIAAGEAITLAR